MKFILIFSFTLLFSQELDDLAAIAIKNILPNDSIISRKEILFDDIELNPIEKKFRQRFYKKSLTVWLCQDINKQERYVVMDHVIGKVQAITFLVFFTEKDSIYFVELIKYRESHGGEVQRRSFLEQFSKNQESVFTVGKNIKNISGATLSVQSMVKGMNKLQALYPLIKKKFHD